MTQININDGIPLETNQGYIVYDLFKGSAMLFINSDLSCWYSVDYTVVQYIPEYISKINTSWEYFLMSEDEVLDHYVVAHL